MAIAYDSAGAGSGTETNLASLDVVCPATITAGDILIAHVIYTGTTTGPSTPANWTALYGPANVGATTATARHWVFGKIAIGDEDGTTIGFGTAGGTEGRAGRIYRFTGRVSGTIAQCVPSASFSTTAHDTDPQGPAVTTTLAGALAVACMCQDDNNTEEAIVNMTGGTWGGHIEYSNATWGPQGIVLYLNTATPTANPGTITGGAMVAANDEAGTIGFEIRATSITPPTTVLDTPDNNATGVSITPDLLFTGTDDSSDEVEYEVQVDTAVGFNSGAGSLITNSTTRYEEAMYAGSMIKKGQSFTGIATNLTALKVNLKKVGSPTGTITAYLYNANAGPAYAPTGGALATSTNSIDVNTDLTTSYQQKTFNFNNYTLSAATVYVITFEFTSTSSDSSNYISSYYSGDSISGNRSTYVSSWGGNTSYDCECEIWTSSGSGPLLDILSSTEDPSHFAGTGSPSPFPSGNQITYSVQAAAGLLNNTAYYWRVRAIDPSGTNTWGAWSLGDASDGYNKFTTVAAGTLTTMAVTVGAFTLTGITTGFLRPVRNMIASLGQFTLTGVTVGLLRPIRNMVVSVGGFTLTGISVIFNKTLSIIASVGQFTLTGITVGLLRPVRNMVVTTGEFTLTGIAAILSYISIAGTNMQLNIADAWKNVSSAKLNISDSWKNVIKIQKNIGDVWKTIFEP